MSEIKASMAINNYRSRFYKESSYSKKTNGLVYPNNSEINSIFSNKQSSKKSSIPVPPSNNKPNKLLKSKFSAKNDIKNNHPVSSSDLKPSYNQKKTSLKPYCTKRNNKNNNNLEQKYKKSPEDPNKNIIKKIIIKNKENALIYKRPINDKKNNSADVSTQCDTYEKTTSTSTSDTRISVSTQTDSAITQTANKKNKNRTIIDCKNIRRNKNLTESFGNISNIDPINSFEPSFSSQSKISYKVILENGDANHYEILDFSDFQLKTSYKVISENGDENHSDTFNFSDSQSKNSYTVHNNSTNTESCKFVNRFRSNFILETSKGAFDLTVPNNSTNSEYILKSEYSYIVISKNSKMNSSSNTKNNSINSESSFK